jgi:hypothetical protein
MGISRLQKSDAIRIRRFMPMPDGRSFVSQFTRHFSRQAYPLKKLLILNFADEAVGEVGSGCATRLTSAARDHCHEINW